MHPPAWRGYLISAFVSLALFALISFRIYTHTTPSMHPFTYHRPQPSASAATIRCMHRSCSLKKRACRPQKY